MRRQRKAAAAAFAAASAESSDTPKHAADDPGVPVPAGAPVPDSSGGAHEAPPARPAGEPSGALRGYTDQFEVLKVPRRPAGPPTA
jgi:HAE1 family hydrophobic/amphiphilic exporter-1